MSLTPGYFWLAVIAVCALASWLERPTKRWKHIDVRMVGWIVLSRGDKKWLTLNSGQAQVECEVVQVKKTGVVTFKVPA